MAYTLTYSFSNNTYAVTGYTGTPDNIVIPDTYNDGTHGEYPVTSIGDRAFKNCFGLTSVTITDSVTVIDDYAFYGCTELTSVVIPNSVRSIGDFAFAFCTSLKSIVIPNFVTRIGNYAFEVCRSLIKITCIPATPPTLDSNAFSSISSSAQFIIPQSSLSAYQTALNWTAYASKMVGKDNNWFNFLNYTAENKKFINSSLVASISQANKTVVLKSLDDTTLNTIQINYASTAGSLEGITFYA